MGLLNHAASKVILAAAVIDDVLGLVILAVVTGVIAAADRGTALSYAEIGLVLGKAVAFLFGALLLVPHALTFPGAFAPVSNALQNKRPKAHPATTQPVPIHNKPNQNTALDATPSLEG